MCGSCTTEDLWEPLTRLRHLKDLTLQFDCDDVAPLREQNWDNLPMLETICMEGPCCGFSGHTRTGAFYRVENCIHFTMTHLK